MSDAREEANRRWPKDWNVQLGTWRDGAINGFILGAEWKAQRMESSVPLNDSDNRDAEAS